MTRLVGLRSGAGGIQVGLLSDDGADIGVLATVEDFWAAPEQFLAERAPVEAVRAAQVELVPPVLPGAQVVCVGLNYADHVAEGSFADADVPSHPTLFARWSASLSVGGAAVPVPPDEAGLDWEGEVVAWVGRALVDAAPDEALAAVVGYSTFNDLTARRAQKRTSQWTLGKNADRSGPLGPMVPAAEVGDLRDGLRLETRVNGEVVQQGSTSQMIHTVGDTLAHISRVTTLRPGDLLATGTPQGVGYARTPPWLLGPGDVVEVEVERLGTLVTPVVACSERHRL